MFRIVAGFLFLPVLLIIDVFNSKRAFARKVLWLLPVIFLFGYTWGAGYASAIRLTQTLLFQAGVSDRPLEITVVGDSMMPNIQSGSRLTLHSPRKYKIDRGDVVSFQNLETGNRHYLKRVVGLPNEEIALRHGFVTVGGRILEEGYVLNNLPTYGNTFITECNLYRVPEGHYLVLGDNRTVSFDSRAIGFVSEKDIDGVIKDQPKATFANQEKQKQILKASVDPVVTADKINASRRNQDAAPLSPSQTLDQVAKLRAESINNSFEDWKNRAASLESLLQQQGYQYNSIHEFVTFGYLDEESVVQQVQESSIDQMAFSSSNYQEIGLASSEKAHQGCTFPIIVLVIGWPNVPVYNPELIDHWQQEQTTTKQIINFLQGVSNVPGFDQTKVRQLTQSLTEANSITEQLNQKISHRQQLDYQLIQRYQQILKENQPLLDELYRKM